MANLFLRALFFFAFLPITLPFGMVAMAGWLWRHRNTPIPGMPHTEGLAARTVRLWVNLMFLPVTLPYWMLRGVGWLWRHRNTPIEIHIE